MSTAEAGFFTDIDIEKFVNGVDADVAPGPLVPVGSTVTFTYSVIALGQAPIDNVIVRDDNGTPGNPGDDFFPTFTGGDTISNNRLDLGETWTYIAAALALPGQYENFGFAEGSGDGIPVSDFDPGHYFGVAAQVPEPATLLLLGVGLAGLGYHCRSRRPRV